ncbi:PREDICTED: aminoacylase-1-like [Dinoponera quadriceps]|uniref:Aminoacylase-1-like n=1 Tax=Dinoponera quadriceps TaxID=609295 RepID=A0A6P3XB03_DINQU|nr:PREDICTED: aminoacylase-1-like [Dinoponera quadriceps]
MHLFQGGVQNNVIPDEIIAEFDIRLQPTYKPDEFEALVKRWCEEAGPGVTYSFVQKNPQIKGTKIDDSNPFWVAFKNVFSEIGSELKPIIIWGTSDARYLRQLSIPTLGFVPLCNTPSNVHGANECVNKDVFLRGIDIFTKIIPAIANV